MRPQNLGQTIQRLMHYMGNHAIFFVFVGILVATSALGNLFGTYMIRPIVNDVLNTGLDQAYIQIGIMALIFLVGVLSTLGYTQLMAVAAQKVVQDIRRDLFHIMQKLPLQFFDTHSHGELMSRFTNDVDTVSDALNNSFAMMIQSFIQVTGTLILLFVLSWRLSLVVLIFYVFMFAYIRFSSAKSKSYFSLQQKNIGLINGFIEEMISGQKVVKVFNHENANQTQFEHFNMEIAKEFSKSPGLFSNDCTYGGFVIIYQLCDRICCRRVYVSSANDGCWFFGKLSCLCSSSCNANQSIHHAIEFITNFFIWC